MIYTHEQVIQLMATVEAVGKTIMGEINGKIKPLTKKEARKAYGYENVNNWEKQGLIKPTKGSNNRLKLFRVSDLERVSRSIDLSIRITNGY